MVGFVRPWFSRGSVRSHRGALVALEEVDQTPADRASMRILLPDEYRGRIESHSEAIGQTRAVSVAV